MKKIYMTLATLLFIALTPFTSALAFEKIYTSEGSNLAISGYDTVSYFTENKAIQGDPEFSTSWQGAIWQFSSQENLALFEKNPEYYAPQYGGHCAWAVASEKSAPGNPEVWAIENDKLYLNYNDNVQERWNKDRAGFIEEADKKWPHLVEDKAEKQ